MLRRKPEAGRGSCQKLKGGFPVRFTPALIRLILLLPVFWPNAALLCSARGQRLLPALAAPAAAVCSLSAALAVAVGLMGNLAYSVLSALQCRAENRCHYKAPGAGVSR